MKKTLDIFGMPFEVTEFEMKSCSSGGPDGYLVDLSISGPLVNVTLTVESSVLRENKIFKELFVKEKDIKKLDDYDVLVHCCGSVTMALLYDNEKKVAYFGSAIKQKEDNSDVPTGVKLATDRALGIIPLVPDSRYTDSMKKEISNFIERHNCGYSVEGFYYGDI